MGRDARNRLSVLEGAMANKKKGKSKITVYPDWCKGCGICVEFCPGRVLELSDQGKATVVREQDCIRCGFCELHCPDFAIVVQDKEFVEADQLKEQEKQQSTGKGA
jgi:2-oxoglutarate ferredoxin oxidoreductase subunit delta